MFKRSLKLLIPIRSLDQANASARIIAQQKQTSAKCDKIAKIIYFGCFGNPMDYPCSSCDKGDGKTYARYREHMDGKDLFIHNNTYKLQRSSRPVYEGNHSLLMKNEKGETYTIPIDSELYSFDYVKVD